MRSKTDDGSSGEKMLRSKYGAKERHRTTGLP
jgi:hypothetical protein